MVIAELMTNSQWQIILTEISQRNGMIELQVPGDQTFDHDTLCEHGSKVRVLDFNSDHLLVERPSSTKMPSEFLQSGQVIQGLLFYKNHRWMFDCQVLGLTDYAMNKHVKTQAIRLSLPTKFCSAQRRQFFRVPLTSIKTAPVQIWPLNDADTCVLAELMIQEWFKEEQKPDTPPPRPDVGQPVLGNLKDISGSGFSVSLNLALQDIFSTHHLFWTKLQLPELAQPLFATINRTRMVTDYRQNELTVGFNFTFDHHPNYKKFIEEQLCQYTTTMQRKLLKRHR